MCKLDSTPGQAMMSRSPDSRLSVSKSSLLDVDTVSALEENHSQKGRSSHRDARLASQ
jgi:hypothetical protein